MLVSQKLNIELSNDTAIPLMAIKLKAGTQRVHVHMKFI